MFTMQFRVAKLSKKTTAFKNWNNFCCLAFVSLFCQLQTSAQQVDSVKLKSLVLNPSGFSYFNKSASSALQNGQATQKIKTNLGSPFAHWGFMCIGEYKLEQKTGVPFRFRLGSLDYVNKLEGKRSAF